MGWIFLAISGILSQIHLPVGAIIFPMGIIGFTLCFFNIDNFSNKQKILKKNHWLAIP